MYRRAGPKWQTGLRLPTPALAVDGLKLVILKNAKELIASVTKPIDLSQKELYDREKKNLPFSFIYFAPQITSELQQHLNCDPVVPEVTGFSGVTESKARGFMGEATEGQT